VIHPALIVVKGGTLPNFTPSIQNSMRPIDVTEPFEQYADHDVYRHGQYEP
jgi:hypothetical protein